MRSVCQSINLLCTAFGSLAAAGFNSVCSAWLPNNLDDGHLDYVFFLLGGVMLVNIGLFALLARRFTPRSDAATVAEVRVSTAQLRASGPIAMLEGGVRLSRNSRLSFNRTTASVSAEHLDALLGPAELGLSNPVVAAAE